MIADDEVWVWVTFLFDLDRNKGLSRADEYRADAQMIYMYEDGVRLLSSLSSLGFTSYLLLRTACFSISHRDRHDQPAT